MIRTFEVTASTVPGTELTADVVLTVLDYDYHIQETRNRFEERASLPALESSGLPMRAS